MRRREFINLMGGVPAVWPLTVRAQQGEGIKRLGLLIGGTREQYAATNRQLPDGLAQLGWVEGQRLRIDLRLVGSNDPAVIGPHAEALVRAAPDVIYATPATAVQVLQHLTSSIPIVLNQSGDPVQAGTVASLARPGGNITGFLTFEPSMNTKFLQLLKDIAPRMTRVGVLQSEATQTARGGNDFVEVEQASRTLGVAAISMLVRDDATDIERVIADFAQVPNGGLILAPDNALNRNYALVAMLAAKHRLPAICNARRFVDAGLLMYYGAVPLDLRRVASYIDRILRGAKPSELPVVTPDKFELVINLKTATALGLTIPPSLFALADEVVE
jgi:putative ABC transport system substrate-binding protein